MLSHATQLGMLDVRIHLLVPGRGKRLPLAWLSNLAQAAVALVRQGCSFLPDSEAGLTAAVFDWSVIRNPLLAD